MKTVHQKLQEVMKLVSTTLPELKGRELYLTFDHVARYCNGTRKHLSEDEKVLIDLLQRNGYSPRAVLVWVQVLKLPEDLQDELKKGTVSLNGAFRERNKRKEETVESLKAEILADIRNCLEDLKNADKNKLKGVV
ncbi:MAG: hypothetical protein ABIF10_07045 [Candidatus Woesearchaeota archaeon]